jgi:hypothetical protein
VPEKAIEEFKLSAGDRLMLYSHALIEVWNDDGEILGVEGLEARASTRTAPGLFMTTSR